MLMENERKVENYLMNIGYHRLSAYIYPFYKNPKRDLVLKEGTTFEQAQSRCLHLQVTGWIGSKI